jgi:putative transcriptional regulator
MKNNVKTIRNAKGLTQEELAGLLNVSRQTIISIESSRYVPSTVLSLKIAMYLDKSVEELFVLEQSDFDSK